MLQSRFYMTIVGIQLEARREMLLRPCSVALRQQRVCSDTMRFDEGLPAKFLRRQGTQGLSTTIGVLLEVDLRVSRFRRSTRVVSTS